jgi:hypothetical protein
MAGQPYPAGSAEAASSAVQAVHFGQAQQAAQTGVNPGFPNVPGGNIPQHLQTNPGPQVGYNPAGTSPVGAPAAPGTPALADDADLIEKEWVVKAKQIVAQTKFDPYLQSAELNKLKAEYVKKRYNKEIKLPES